MRSIGQLHRAMAPGNFTYSSHAAMFMGFTPGIATLPEPYVNPKFSKIFQMEGGGFSRSHTPRFFLQGSNIVDGFRKAGYKALGSGAVAWFNPATLTGRNLTRDFDDFFFAGVAWRLEDQLAWLAERVTGQEKNFVFLNIGETHVPYYYKGADWSEKDNPCIPFSERNNADECRRRQISCLEYVDKTLAALLEAFRDCTTLICADHGDCWGEDGLWEHGIHHEKTLEVPLIFSVK